MDVSIQNQSERTVKDPDRRAFGQTRARWRPRGVEPAKIVEAVRLAAIRRQGENHIKAEDIPCIADDDTPGQLIVSAFRKYKK